MVEQQLKNKFFGYLGSPKLKISQSFLGVFFWLTLYITTKQQSKQLDEELDDLIIHVDNGAQCHFPVRELEALDSIRAIQAEANFTEGYNA